MCHYVIVCNRDTDRLPCCVHLYIVVLLEDSTLEWNNGLSGRTPWQGRSSGHPCEAPHMLVLLKTMPILSSVDGHFLFVYTKSREENK